MRRKLEIIPMGWEQIKSLQKLVDGRVPKLKEDGTLDDFSDLEENEPVDFLHYKTKELLGTMKIHYVVPYASVEDMIEGEGLKRICPHCEDNQELVDIYMNIGGYSERMKEYGIVAIALKPL